MRRVTFTAFALALALGMIVVQPSQATVPWSNSWGSTSLFDWNSGQNDTGLFGDPTIVGNNAFRFTPSGFIAQGANGSDGDARDIASWNVVAKDGITFSGLRLVERGTWDISGPGPGNSVSAAAVFSAIENTFGSTVSDSRSFAQYTTGSGTWTFDMTLDLSWAAPTSLQISLDNHLIAISNGDSDSCYIRKQLAGGIVEVEIIPEPTSLALLALGLLGLVRRPRLVAQRCFPSPCRNRRTVTRTRTSCPKGALDCRVREGSAGRVGTSRHGSSRTEARTSRR
jgi:hypothetical protein